MKDISKQTNKQLAKALVEKHGPKRWFMIWLYRLRMMGWVFFSILLAYLLLLNTYLAFKPPNILVLNEQGRVVGNIDFLGDFERSEAEFTMKAMKYLVCKLSRNSETIMIDFICALTMTKKGTVLFQKDLASITETAELKKIEQLNLKSRLEFDPNKPSPTPPPGDDGIAWRTLKGQLIVIGKTKYVIEFNATVGLMASQRTVKNLSGIEVVAYELH